MNITQGWKITLYEVLHNERTAWRHLLANMGERTNHLRELEPFPPDLDGGDQCLWYGHENCLQIPRGTVLCLDFRLLHPPPVAPGVVQQPTRGHHYQQPIPGSSPCSAPTFCATYVTTSKHPHLRRQYYITRLVQPWQSKICLPRWPYPLQDSAGGQEVAHSLLNWLCHMTRKQDLPTIRHT